tara:strand:- start:4562 stop:5197 length:636 start_codon:yes stop_codon:yes gene_type:complete
MANRQSINDVLDQYHHYDGEPNWGWTHFGVYNPYSFNVGWASNFVSYYYHTQLGYSYANCVGFLVDSTGEWLDGVSNGQGSDNQNKKQGPIIENPSSPSRNTLTDWWNVGYWISQGKGLRHRANVMQMMEQMDSGETYLQTGQGGAAGNGVGGFITSNIKMGDMINFRYKRTSNWPKGDSIDEKLTGNDATGAIAFGGAADNPPPPWNPPS